MNGPKVLDEVICKALNLLQQLDAMFCNIWITRQDLFFWTNSGKTLTIMCHCWALTREVEMADTIGFASKADVHDMPLWMKVHDATDSSSLEVYMSSEDNYQFNEVREED
jgi:hypothetical protein